MSLSRPRNIPGIGNVDDSDILAFTPTSLGTDTDGSVSLFFDGSDIGANTNGEDIDATTFADSDQLVISTNQRYSVSKVGGGLLIGTDDGYFPKGDEDLIIFTDDSFGANTHGGFLRLADGSDINFKNGNEDVDAV